MKIDEVVFVNLESRRDRKQNIQEQLRDNGVPSDIIRPHVSTDAAAYESFEALCQQASLRGYPERFDPHIETPPYLTERRWWVGIGDIACVWTKLRLYDALRKSDSTTLIVEDDCLLQKSFDEIQALIAGIDPDIIQLGFNRHASLEAELHPQALTNGFGGTGEYALVLNPEGAEFLFNLMLHKEEDEPFHLDELVSTHQFQERVCSVTDPHAWITRREDDDSNRIKSTVRDWQRNPDVYLADDIPGANQRKRFCEHYG